GGAVVERILVATHGPGASRAVDWASELAGRCGAELVVVHVVAPEHLAAGEAERPIADDRARTRRVYDSDEAAGMSDRTEFLLASVPNRVSHSARCSVVIVNNEDGVRPAAPERGADES